MVIETQPQLLQMALVESDIVFTPDWVARDMVYHFRPSGKVLDPCRGDGVFYNLIPLCEWCEIEQGRDFFKWTQPVDWVFGNPPYKIFSDWMRHSFEIAQNICYLIPLNKPWNSGKMIKEWKSYGGIVETRYYANGGALDFPIGFACGAVWFQKGYTGGMITTVYS